MIMLRSEMRMRRSLTRMRMLKVKEQLGKLLNLAIQMVVAKKFAFKSPSLRSSQLKF